MAYVHPVYTSTDCRWFFSLISRDAVSLVNCIHVYKQRALRMYYFVYRDTKHREKMKIAIQG